MNENMEENFQDAESSENSQPAQSNVQVSISKQLLLKIVAGALVIVVVAAIGIATLSNKTDARLTVAVAACGVESSSGITFAEDGQSLAFDGKGKDDFTGGDYNDVECLLKALEAPSTVWAQILKTSSNMGQQEDAWDGISISWDYHPDNGLNAYFKIDA